MDSQKADVWYHICHLIIRGENEKDSGGGGSFSAISIYR